MSNERHALNVRKVSIPRAATSRRPSGHQPGTLGRVRAPACPIPVKSLHSDIVNVEALPYTLLLILAELAIGSLWVTLASDLRGGVTRGFVMTMALCIAITAGLTYWSASAVNVGPTVDGYRIDDSWFDPAKRGILIVLVTSVVYMFAVFMGWDPIGRLAGIAGAIAGAVPDFRQKIADLRQWRQRVRRHASGHGISLPLQS